MIRKAHLIKPFAKYIDSNIRKWSKKPIESQNKIFKALIKQGRRTQFGKDHNFDAIDNHDDYVANVPIRSYEEFRPYVDSIIAGERDVLWPGVPKYFAKTSGTTSGIKYIPLTQASMPNHINSARNALFSYINEKGSAEIFNGKMIFISGSPELSITGKIPTGRLSGIVNHELPSYVKTNRMPSDETNRIEDWEEKLEKIVEETHDQDMRMIGGIPPWVQMYFEALLKKTNKSAILEVFPNLKVFMHGGVNYEPYKKSIDALIGGKIDTIETYPASEGFIAFQTKQSDQDLLLNTNSGIFFEFVPLDEIHNENPKRLLLDQVELNKDYAVIINNNAGLWAYNIGDTIRFTKLNPYRLVVSGRVKHYISAFGEHVIGKEVEEAMLKAANEENLEIIEFTVAPQVNPKTEELPYHEWFIEFVNEPKDLSAFELKLDSYLREQNIYYDDLISGSILRPLVVRRMARDSFRNYMKSLGKLGGQNKVPRLSNDRKIANKLSMYVIQN